jgi:hypothetical protein
MIVVGCIDTLRAHCQYRLDPADRAYVIVDTKLLPLLKYGKSREMMGKLELRMRQYMTPEPTKKRKWESLETTSAYDEWVYNLPVKIL